jgi:hypothetical protein
VRILLVGTALSFGLASAPVGADSSAARVRVRGTSRIEPRAGRWEGKLVLSGVLVDDAARPLTGEKIGVSLAADGDRSHPLSLAAGSAVSACAGANAAEAQPTLVRSDLVVVSTDDGGRFCVRVGLAIGRYFARFAFDGSGRVDSTTAELTGDLSLNPVTLRFDPEPRIVDLDTPAPPTIDAIATVDDDSGRSPASGLALTLSNETGASLGVATTNAAGRAQFSIAPSLFGPPGNGELRVSFAGSGISAATVHAAPVERRVRVDLSAPDAREGRLSGGTPEEGVAIDVLASARTAAELHVVPTGTVVARVGDTIVGAAPLVDGHARVVATFGSGAATEASVRLAYTSDAPWFAIGNDVLVTLPIRGPSPWRNAPFLIAGACVLVWLVLGRTRFGARARTEAGGIASRPPSRVEARVDVVRADPGSSGWRGVVVDAHDGRAIADARVSLERNGFDGVAVLASATTDTSGTFALGGVDVLVGDVLTSEAPLHARLEQRAPSAGQLSIALVLRRRALLDRLVAWAKRSGAPFDASVDPTPGQVRRAAGTSFGVARWADAVERTAFGGAPVDARAEMDVDRLAPSPVARGDAQAGAPRRGHENDTIKDPPRDGDPLDGASFDDEGREE